MQNRNNLNYTIVFTDGYMFVQTIVVTYLSRAC